MIEDDKTGACLSRQYLRQVLKEEISSPSEQIELSEEKVAEIESAKSILN